MIYVLLAFFVTVGLELASAYSMKIQNTCPIQQLKPFVLEVKPPRCHKDVRPQPLIRDGSGH
jgi:hypothetical protein